MDDLKDKISAVDAIYQILEIMEKVDHRLSDIDLNIKLLNNRIDGLQNIPQRVGMVTATTSNSKIKAIVQEKKEGNINKEMQREPSRLVLGNVRVFGYIQNKKSEPLSSVIVHIYGSDSELIKSTESDKRGYWSVRLPSGRYGVEYIHSKFNPVNKVIEIDDSVKKYEVM